MSRHRIVNRATTLRRPDLPSPEARAPRRPVKGVLGKLAPVPHSHRPRPSAGLRASAGGAGRVPSSSAFRADSGKPDEQAVEALLSQVFRAAGKEPVPASAVVRLAESMRAVDGQLGDLNQGLRVPEMPLVQAIVMDHFRHVLARLDGESAARAGVDVPTVADGGARVDVPVADGETVSYPLPLPIEDLWGAGDVGRILSPSGRPDRSLARARRLRSELLGVEIGNGWRYPRFQFDVRRKRIHPIVVAVNRRLEVVKDPWGSLEWWYLPAEALGDRSPVDALLSDDFTEESATLLIDLDEQSMV